ncbi:MAG: septal ring lytic transglycosylase RlpA family protein [Bacteroidales bacterium]|nr:septal ring lytic transglycosylase RlpA family protein [Bacteroidales bacterium]
MKIRSLLIALLLLGFYVVKAQTSSYTKIGIASFYADKFEGRQTANGEIYYHAKKTAAHQKLPFGTIVKVTNLENNKFVVVRINDRGPFVDNRIIDLSKSVAEDLDFVSKGLVKVKIEVIANTNDLPDKKSGVKKESAKAYYKLNSKIVNPTGKGIQIGSYTDDENLIKLIAKIELEFKQEVYVEILQVKTKKLYRVIVGNSKDTSLLEQLKSKLKSKYPDCFIVEFK